MVKIGNRPFSILFSLFGWSFLGIDVLSLFQGYDDKFSFVYLLAIAVVCIAIGVAMWPRYYPSSSYR